MKHAAGILNEMVSSGGDNPKKAIHEYETALSAYKLHILSKVPMMKALALADKYRRSVENEGSFLLADEAMNGISLLLDEHSYQFLLGLPSAEYRRLVISTAKQDMQNMLEDYD